MKSKNPFNMKFAPNILNKVLNKLGWLYEIFALANSIFHFLKQNKIKIKLKYYNTNQYIFVINKFTFLIRPLILMMNDH